jgi:aryl-alcohol dehydrogenase-like predicted oxidoreductase
MALGYAVGEEHTMELRAFGKTGLAISPIGLGAWAIGGGDYAFGWGPQDDAESVAAIERAVELGINWVDTAPVYGLGHSEDVVGRALKNLGSHRPLVFTKCSLVWQDGRRDVSHCLEAVSIRREVEASLRRLGVEAIDLMQIHWPRFFDQPTTGTIETAWTELAALQKAGKVRHIGVSNFKVDDMERAAAIAPVETLQPPYSLLRRAIEAEILPYCLSRQVGVIVYSPMQAGLLSGRMSAARVASLPGDDWRTRTPEFQEPRLSKNLAFVEVLRGVGSRHGKSPGEVAVAWVLRLPAVSAAIVGFRRPAQVDGLIGAVDLQLTDADIEVIERALAV